MYRTRAQESRHPPRRAPRFGVALLISVMSVLPLLGATGAAAEAPADTGPELTVQGPPYPFGPTLIGAKAYPTGGMIWNPSSVDAHILSVSATGDFTATPQEICGVGTGVLPAHATCSLQFDFHPTAAGPRTGSAIVTDTGPGSPHIVALSGIGVAPSSISGTVTSTVGGAPIAGATVRFLGTPRLTPDIVATTITDASGQFSMTGLWPAAY